MLRRSLYAPVFLLVICSAAIAEQIPVPALKGTVNDYAGVLTADEAKVLSAKLLAQENATSTQIAILTVGSLKGEPIEKFGIRVGDAWKLGQKGKDNGIVIIQSTGDRKIRIEVGRGIEEKVPDAVCKQIIDTQMVPQFKGKHFAAGYTAAIDSINAALHGTFKANKAAAIHVNGWVIFWIVIAVIVVFIILYYVTDGFEGGDFVGWSSGSASSSGGGYSGGGGSFGGGGASGGY
jgi:uncharacterized protein